MRAPLGGPTAACRGVGGNPNYTPELELMRLANNLDCGNVLLNAGALAITGGGATTAKTVNVVDYLVAGVYATKAASTMAVLAGTILQNNFGGWVFCIDVAGNLSSLFMNQAATLAGVTFPVIAPTLTILGWVRLNPTTATFIGGTTLLDAANTNAIYRDAVGGLGFVVNLSPG